MTELLAFSQSSLMLSPHPKLHHSGHGKFPLNRFQISPPKCFLSTKLPITQRKPHSWQTRVISDSVVPTTFTSDSAGKGFELLPDTDGGSNDNFGGIVGTGNGGGGGGGGRGDGGGGSGGNEDSGKNMKKGMSMSQKLTLAYAFLVGIGGLMGYLKSGSQKSLISGGVSALLLYYVYSTLPTNPFLASSVGVGLSASLLVVMGSRFKKSGKIFPAGVVSVVSFIMTGGYVHGILRGLH